MMPLRCMKGLFRDTQPLASLFLRRDIRAPRAMGEIPIDGLGDAGGEILARRPDQLALELGAVDGVAAVMAGPGGDAGDLQRVRFPIGARLLPVEQRADGLHDLDVGFLVQAADIVGLTDPALLEHTPNGRVGETYRSEEHTSELQSRR